jgi:hypothetical protein
VRHRRPDCDWSGNARHIAQEATGLGGYQFFVTPLSVARERPRYQEDAACARARSEFNVSTIDPLSHLDGVPVMGSAEVRYGRFGFLDDVIHLPVSTEITTRDILFQGGRPS